MVPSLRPAVLRLAVLLRPKPRRRKKKKKKPPWTSTSLTKRLGVRSRLNAIGTILDLAYE